VIAAGGQRAAEAAKAASHTPIVFVVGFDPVQNGLVSSLNRPGGNITGISFFSGAGLLAKRLGLLHELAPKATIIAVLLDATGESQSADVEAAARAIGRQVAIARVASERDFDAAFAEIVKVGAGALLVPGGALTTDLHRQIVAFATRHAIPALYLLREFVDAGGLVSYGPSQTDAYRRGGIYVGRILKGEKPGDLPVELPTKFDLVINLATAKALGFEIPPTLLARADEVIE
jgi:putative ABC transport system substrate-binding protein